MNKTENLYIVASEECAEIQQCISKILRFGENNYHPSNPEETNEIQLITEFYQLQAVMEMIIEQGIINDISKEEIETIKSNKKYKVSKYTQLSESLGRIVNDKE